MEYIIKELSSTSLDSQIKVWDFAENPPKLKSEIDVEPGT